MSGEPIRCGTYQGWQRHLRRAEKLCPDCARVGRHYMRAYRATRNQSTKATVSVDLLKQLIATAPPALRPRIVEELGRPVLTVWGLIPKETS